MLLGLSSQLTLVGWWMLLKEIQRSRPQFQSQHLLHSSLTINYHEISCTFHCCAVVPLGTHWLLKAIIIFQHNHNEFFSQASNCYTTHYTSGINVECRYFQSWCLWYQDKRTEYIIINSETLKRSSNHQSVAVVLQTSWKSQRLL